MSQQPYPSVALPLAPSIQAATASPSAKEGASFLAVATPLLYLYFVGLYIRPQDWWAPMLGWPIDWVIFGALACCAPFYLGSIPRLFQGHSFKLLLVWLAVIVASNLVHGETWYARTAFLMYLRFSILFGTMLVYLVRPGQIRALIWLIILMTALLAWQSIDQVAHGVGWAGQTLSWDDGFGQRARWVGMWDGPNVLCLLFVLVYPFLFEFALPPSALPVRLLSIGLGALIFRGILLTQSRGGFLALAVAMAFAVALRFRFKKALPAMMAAMLVLVVLAPGRMGNLDDRSGSKSGYNRVELWSAGLQMLKVNPLLGIGKTRWIDFSSRYSGIRLIAHNSFVENLGETGALGLSVYIALSFLVIKGLWRLKNSPSLAPPDLAMTRAFLTSACSYAATSMFITTDFDLFYVQLGLASAFLASHNALPRLSRRDVVIIGALTVGFVVCLYTFIQLYL